MELLLLFVGVYYTVKSRCFPQRHLGKAFRSVFGKRRSNGDEISVFSSMCTNLAATLGTGNIVGVTAAVMTGGAGALLWMIVAAFFGMATKCAENMLAVHYRGQMADGTLQGGPHVYLSEGARGRFSILAPVFCSGCILSGVLGMGTVTQSNSISLAVCSLMPDSVYGIRFLVSCVVTVLAAFVILGGGKRIARISELLIPAMSVCYVMICGVILVRFRARIPWALQSMFREAFDVRSAGGAAAGIGIMNAMQVGMRRGVFSNEAGLGTSPIAAASSGGTALEHGYAAIVSVFVDTVLLCTLTGLCVLVTGSSGNAATAVAAAASAITDGLPLPRALCSGLFSLMLSVFAFSTILGWNFYAERCAAWLFQSRRAVIAYQCLYLAAVFLGPFLSAEFAWRAADAMNWLMVVPNLLALWFLRREVLCEMK